VVPSGFMNKFEWIFRTENMKPDRLIRYTTFSLIILGIISIGWWLGKDPTGDFVESVPGLDNRGGGFGSDEKIVIGELFENFGETYTELSETWPRFRGEDFDNISKSRVPLKDKFGTTGPEILWSVELGEGHSGAAIWKGLVYILDYDEDERADYLRCFSLTSGQELWKRGYNVAIKRNHGMSRTVPAVTEEYILTMGPRCHVMALDRETGDFLWGIDVEKDYESEVPLWYTGQCPLIDENVAIIATGGNALMIGVDMATGEKLWETPNPNGWKMSHSSVIPFEFGGRKMFVYSAIGGLVGIAADGDDVGTVLWEVPQWNKSVVAPSPVCMPDGRIFITAGYGAGGMMLQLKANNGQFTVDILADYAPREGLGSEQQTPLLWNGHLFGILPKDGGTLRNQLVCVHPSDPQKIVWSSGSDVRFGLGPFILADNKMYLWNDDGTLFILQPSLTGYIELDQARVIEDGHDAWAPIAVADGFMVVRDSKTLVCLNMKK
jgi:outer membrane protein assembly factor BamB